MYILESLKKPFIWIKRFRKRRGYNVHSPFAFNFITAVLYQRGTYYRYSDIEKLDRSGFETIKILKLIFRLVNFIQPKTIYYKSTNSAIPLVMQWAKSDSLCKTDISSCNEIDFVYISYATDTENIVKTIEQVWSKLHSQSILVLSGIGYSKALEKIWNDCIQNEEAGISFDLYDMGILFFDKSKNKQDYVVNF